MADAAPPGIQLFKNVAGAEVAFFRPQQIQHHAALTAESHAADTALLKNILQPPNGGDVHLRSGPPQHKSCVIDLTLNRSSRPASGQIRGTSGHILQA